MSLLFVHNKSEFNLSFVYLLQVLKILRNILLILCFWYSVFHKSLSICIHSKLVLILLVFLIYQTTPTTNGGEIVDKKQIYIRGPNKVGAVMVMFVWYLDLQWNQCLSPLKLWIQIPLRRGVLDTALCNKVCQWPVPEMRASLWLARNFFFGPVKNSSHWSKWQNGGPIILWHFFKKKIDIRYQYINSSD